MHSLEGGEIGGVKFGNAAATGGAVGRSAGAIAGGSAGTLEKVQKEKQVSADVKATYAFPQTALKYSEHLVVSVDYEVQDSL